MYEFNKSTSNRLFYVLSYNKENIDSLTHVHLLIHFYSLRHLL